MEITIRNMIGFIWGLNRDNEGYIGIMENKLQTTTVWLSNVKAQVTT